MPVENHNGVLFLPDGFLRYVYVDLHGVNVGTMIIQLHRFFGEEKLEPICSSTNMVVKVYVALLS